MSASGESRRPGGEPIEARVRRAPKYSVFMTLGAALGVFVAAALTLAFDGTAEPDATTDVQYSTLQVFGFLALGGIAAGVLLGGILALVLDRTVGRRARVVGVDREAVVSAADEDDAPDRAEPAPEGAGRREEP